MFVPLQKYPKVLSNFKNKNGNKQTQKKNTIITTFVVVGKAVIFLPFLNLTVGH